MALKLAHIFTSCGRIKDIIYSDIQFIVCVVFQVWLPGGNTLFPGLLVVQIGSDLCDDLLDVSGITFCAKSSPAMTFLYDLLMHG